MKAGLRFCIAAAATLMAFAHAPAIAQDPLAPTTNAPASDAIGPREVENFSLNGTVTRAAETPPATAAPAPTPDRATAPDVATRLPADGPARSPAASSRSTEPTRPDPSVSVSLPPAEALSDAPSATPVDAPAANPGLETPATLPSEGGSILPWLLALIVIGAGAGYYFWRQRSTHSYAAAGAVSRFVPPEPAPSLQPQQRAPGPQPAASAASGAVVSTRLRPWLDIEFAPSRCVVEEDKATIDFDVVITNTGNTPARDVLIEASLFNAGPSQDQEIGGFFEHPVAKGDRIPAIPPMRKVAVKSAVSLTRAQMRQFEVAGRSLFVPLIGFNALYRWSGGDGQTSASYLLGRDTKSEKMAPFRLDLGPRIFRGLGAREHSLRVRN